eukprot:NODE_33_length_36935_cov_1.609241.p12 type:complete len:350 gc:universal NODE_33_length_36935_cov_1.609241:18890-17841(-)
MQTFDPFDPLKTIAKMFKNQNYDHLFVFNYMFESSFCKSLFANYNFKSMTVIAQKTDHLSEFRYITPKMPYTYGTHHTKMFIALSREQCTIIVHTANIIPRDWKHKTQGFYRIDGQLGSTESTFRSDLIDYVKHYGNLSVLSSLLKLYHFDTSLVLIASVPGHTNASNYGLAKVRALFKDIEFDTLIIQCSSIGRLGTTFKKSPIYSLMNAFNCKDFQFIYPTLENVKRSYAGLDSGLSLPHQEKNYKLHKNWLIPHLYKWVCQDSDLNQCIPHIKTFCILKNGELRYILTTSHNISTAAWGLSDGSGILIKSYELGILEKGACNIPYKLPLEPYSKIDQMWRSDFLSN